MQIDLQHVVKLARIELSAEEEQRIGPQLSEIIQYVEKLNELDVDGIEPTAHAVQLTNVLREDQPRPSHWKPVAGVTFQSGLTTLHVLAPMLQVINVLNGQAKSRSLFLMEMLRRPPTA